MGPYLRPVLEPPGGAKKVLLASCCAPCSGEIMEAMRASAIDFTVFFFNPNIQPQGEYEKRRDENARFAREISVPFVEAEYEPEVWLLHAKGMEWEPERGARCSMCFAMRLKRAARFACENGFPVLTSSLGISRWKDMAEVNACGRTAAGEAGLVYWDYNWRKSGGSLRSDEIARREGFYRQEYCGCIYSLRDTNRRRLEQGREAVKVAPRSTV